MNEAAKDQTKPLPVQCHNCQGTKLEWSCHAVNQGGVVDGRIRMSEVGVVFALGCSECSETLARVSGDQFVERFAAAEKQMDVYHQALWMSLDMAFDYTRGGVLGWYWTSRDASMQPVCNLALSMIRDNHPDALTEQKTDGSVALIKVIAERDALRDRLASLMECFGRDGTYLKTEPDEADKASEQVVYRGKTTWDWWAKAHAYGSMVHGINPILGVREGEMTVDAARRAVAERDAARNRQERDVRDMHAAYEQRDALRSIIDRALQALPVGNIQTHTAESLPGRIDELVKRYAETDKLEAERDEALAKLAALEAKHKGKE